MTWIASFRLIFYQLLRPFSYLRIKHEDKKVYDWVLPAILTILTLVVFKYTMPISSVVESNGVIAEITSFVSNLPGFFIAALAAVATFNKNDIDQLMPYQKLD